VHLLLAEEIVVGVRDHVDDGIADAEDIKTSCGHKSLCTIVGKARRTIAVAFSGAILTSWS
jgi:hypothetical protein